MSRGFSNHQRFLRQELAKPWVLKLFITRESAACAGAIVQLTRIKEEYLPPGSRIEVIDIFDQPEVLEEEQILAIPTLVRIEPLPVRRVIGDLSNITTVLISIGLHLPQESSVPN